MLPSMRSALAAMTAPLLGLLLGLPLHAAQAEPDAPAPEAKPEASEPEASNTEAVQREATELLQALKAYSAAQKDELAQQARKTFATLDQRIQVLQTRLEQRSDEMGQAARQQARERLEQLRQQRQQAGEWVENMQSSSGEAWDEMKHGFTAAYRDLHAAWKRSEAAFDSEPEAAEPSP
jgi:DNA anti-recombination protein RmuC